MEGGCEGLFQGQISGNLCEFVFDNISSPRRARQDIAVLLDLLEPVYHCDIVISRSSPLTPAQIECSYDSERPTELMFGHMSPLGVMHELGLFAREVATLNTITWVLSLFHESRFLEV